jgi:hypothetical protein
MAAAQSVFPYSLKVEMNTGRLNSASNIYKDDMNRRLDVERRRGQSRVGATPGSYHRKIDSSSPKSEHPQIKHPKMEQNLKF